MNKEFREYLDMEGADRESKDKVVSNGEKTL